MMDNTFLPNIAQYKIIDQRGFFVKIQTILLTGIGLLLLGIGAIGIFLPILPTTPFVLGAVGCLSGTPRLRNRIIKIPVIREYIENYKNKKGLPVKTVVSSLVFLWGMMLISIIVVNKPWLTVLLALIGIAVSVHIVWISGLGRTRDIDSAKNLGKTK